MASGSITQAVFSKVNDPVSWLLPEPFGPATNVNVGTSGRSFGGQFTYDGAVCFSGLCGVQAHFKKPAVGALQNLPAGCVDKHQSMTRGERLVPGSTARLSSGFREFGGQDTGMDHTT